MCVGVRWCVAFEFRVWGTKGFGVHSSCPPRGPALSSPATACAVCHLGCCVLDLLESFCRLVRISFYHLSPPCKPFEHYRRFLNRSRFRDAIRSQNSLKKLANPEGNSQLVPNCPNSKAPEKCCSCRPRGPALPSPASPFALCGVGCCVLGLESWVWGLGFRV